MRTNELGHLENHVLDFKSSGMDCAKFQIDQITKYEYLSWISRQIFEDIFPNVKLFLQTLLGIIIIYSLILHTRIYADIRLIRFSEKNYSSKVIILLIVGNKTIYIHRQNSKLFQYPPLRNYPFSPRSNVYKPEGLVTKKLYPVASN